MRVLITGAAGVLGKTVTRMLDELGGYQLRLTDVLPAETDHEFVTADLAVPAQVEGLCEGMDQVLHIAALHPWKPYTPEQYLDSNIKGTYHLIEEAARAGVSRFLYTSSIAAMGYQADSLAELPFDETRVCRPDDGLYGVSKHVGEQFCHIFRLHQGLPYVILRPGCFIPRGETDPRYGLALLSTYLHFDDCARGHVLALQSEVKDEAFILTAHSPFRAEEAEELRRDAPAVILRHFPQAARLAQRGLELPASITHWYTIEKARRMLGYEPEHNFGQWLEQVLAS